jgi:tetratricopeptide (TPR) repeat protein
VLGFEKLIHYSLIAGQSALRSFAWSEALEHFENVRQVVESMPTRIELVHAWLGVARARFTCQSKYGSKLGPHEIEAGLALAFDIFIDYGEVNYAIQTASQGIVGELAYVLAISLSERAIEFATDDSVQVTALWVRYADVLWSNDSRREESDSAFERAMEMAEKHNDVPLQLRILRIRTQFSQHNKQYDKILLMRHQALKLNRTTASDMDLSLLHVHAAIAEASIGETKKSTISLDTAKLIANELGIESNLYHLTCANLALAQAKFDDAIEHARELERIENGPVEAMFDLLKRAYTGDLTEALKFGKARVAELPDNRVIQSFRVVYSLMILWIGTELKDEDTIAESTAVLRSFTGETAVDGFTSDMLARMRIKTVIGSGSELERLQEYEALLLEQNTFAIGSGGPAHDQMLAELSLALCNRDQALVHYQKSLQLCRKAGFTLTECETALAYAETLIDHGSRAEIALAIKILKDSLKLSDEFELKNLSEKITALLAKTSQG